MAKNQVKTKTFLAAEIIMESKTRKETHTDKEKKDILLQFTSSKRTSPFLQFEIFMEFKRLRRKQNKNKAMLTFAFKKSLKTTLPSQDQEFRHGYEARS